jgi:hypothetical protein
MKDSEKGLLLVLGIGIVILVVIVIVLLHSDPSEFLPVP